MAIRTVTIIGAGAGGCATAAVLGRKGIKVRLYDISESRIDLLSRTGGLYVIEESGDEFVPISLATTDLAEALEGTDLIQVMTSAAGQRGVARALAPHLRDGHRVLICSGASGSLEFARMWREMGVAADVLLGETVTLPQSARLREDARLIIRLPARLRTAAFPGERTAELCDLVSELYDIIPVRDVLDTGLNNPNFLIHPVPMVLNYTAVERSDGLFSLMNEGMTRGTLRAFDAFDCERMALAARLGLPVLSVDEIYTEFGSSPAVYREPGEPMGIKDRIHDRYLDDDIPFGSMLLASLGDQIGVDTPVVDATNALACIITGKDYWGAARTCEKLGLAGMSVQRIVEFVQKGC